MATGRLGTADLAAATNTTVYTCPADTFAVVTLSMCNRGATAATIQVQFVIQRPLATTSISNLILV